MSGYGHVLEMGTYGKIKLLMAENNKEKFVLKIFLVKPSSHLPILKNVGHLIACAQKNINQKTMQLFPYLGVDLFKFFTQLPKPVPINMVITVLDIIFKTILAVEDLHKKNIAHLDLKLENIVWDEHQKKIHLIDFDFAEEFTINEKNERVVLIGGMRGTLTYLPPEILKILPTSSQYLKDDRITEAICLQNGKLCYQFSQKTEIYALGKTIKRALRHVDCQETQFYFDEMRYLSILMSHILAENRPDFDFMKMISIYCLLYVEAKANQHGDDIFKTQVENQLKIHQCGITQFEFVKLIVQNSLMNTEYPATLYHFVKNPYLFEMFRQHGTLSMCQYIITREKSIEDVKSPAWLRFVEYHKNFYTKLRFNYNDQRFFCQNECQTQQEICNEIDALFQRQLSCDDPLDERNLIPINNEITTLMQSLQTLEAQSKQAVTDPKIVT